MVHEKSSPFVFRFGAFEVDLRAGELRKQGVRVRIQEQPFRLLLLLLQRPGEVLTREELRSQIWPSDTFVDFDKGLNTSVNRLREALGDAADNPRFVETVPRRGYRFIAPVTANHPTPDVPENAAVSANRPSSVSKRGMVVGAAAILVLAIAVGIGSPWRWFHSNRLTGKDTIVLADFTNTTGDPVFDGSLRQGLAVELEQSPFLSLLPQDQVQQALRLMKRPADIHLNPEIAWEVCQRTNGTVVIEGSISQIGSRYDLVLRAFSCFDRSFLASTETQASDKNHVLEALSQASSNIRKKLGESIGSVQKYNVPLEQATTASLDALRAYSLGYQAITGNGDSAAAIPLFQRALQLDPNFAMANVLLGTSYWNLGESDLASENIRKAFELRADTSEYERLRIETEYHLLVTCDLLKGKDALEVWVQTYPRDWAPRNRLGVTYLSLGQQDRALNSFDEAHKLHPHSSLIWGNLISSYIALNQFTEAKAAADEAKKDNANSPGVRINLYRLAFLEENRDEMKQEVAFSVGKPGLEDELLWNEAASDAFSGRVKSSRAHYREAILSAERSGEPETGVAYETDAALMEAMLGFHNESLLHSEALIPRLRGPDMQFKAALALAVAGETNRADALARHLDGGSPQDTVVQFLYLPIVRAANALNRHDAPQAIESLRTTAPYEFSVNLMAVYFRGLGYLGEQKGAEAEAEFEKVINHSGVVLNAPIGSLAYLQLGRAYSIQGESEKARNAYHKFFEIWKDADQDVPILMISRQEYSKLH